MSIFKNDTHTNTHTHTQKKKPTAEQIAEWNKRQIEINFKDYERN